MEKGYEQKVRRDLSDALEGRHSRDSLREAVKDVPADIMNRRAANVPYSLWDMLEHIRITQWDILQYILNPAHESPSWPSGYWPDKGNMATAEKWKQSTAAYLKDLDRLKAMITDQTTDIFAPREHMQGNSIFQKAMLVINHTAYHTGEFILCRQVLGNWHSMLEGR
jgi:uncharacterized damage-inducible protein DinB